MSHLNLKLNNLMADEKYGVIISEGNGSIDMKGWNGIATGSSHDVNLSGTGVQKISLEILNQLISAILVKTFDTRNQITLSENDTLATYTGLNSYATVVSDILKNSGTSYFEYEWKSGPGTDHVGIQNGNPYDGNYPFKSSGGWPSIFIYKDGNIWCTKGCGTVAIANVGSFAIGDRMGFGVNFDTRTVDAYKNGIHLGQIATGFTNTSWKIMCNMAANGHSWKIYTSPSDILHPQIGFETGWNASS